MAQDTLISFDNLEAVLNEYGKEVRNQYQLNLIHSDRIASGELLNSCEFDVKLSNRTYQVRLELADYWKYVEYGRKPGKFPPTSKILDWILIKPVLPRPDDKIQPTPKQLAFLIGRKIANEGYEGSKDLEKANDSLIKRFEPKIVAALAKDLGTYMQKFVIEKVL